jgi:hypothetical protein
MEPKAVSKKKLRSPNCPTISLQEALGKARKVYEEEHTHPAAKEVIAQDLGYSGISGPSASVIGALRQYGIMEPSGDGLRISDDAVSVFELPEDSPERIAALARLAFKPALFEELRQQFGDRPPGEGNLRHLLIKKGFLSNTADEVIQAFRENLELAGTQSVEYNEQKDKVRIPMYEGQPLETLRYPPIEKASKVMQSQSNTNSKPNSIAAQVLAISIPRNLSVNIDVRGNELKREDLAKIKSQFNRWIEGLEEAFEE